MTDEEFEEERKRIDGIAKQADLILEIAAFSKRRQLDSAAHGALLGHAVTHAIERGWVPKGRAEFKAYCETQWGSSVSQVNQYRRLSKDWPQTRRAQELLLANREKLSGDVKLPEVGSTALNRIVAEVCNDRHSPRQTLVHPPVKLPKRILCLGVARRTRRSCE